MIIASFGNIEFILAVSPTVSNNELLDPPNDFFDVTNNITTILGPRSIDIYGVTYFSNGKFLNATIWTGSSVEKSKDNLGFGIYRHN